MSFFMDAKYFYTLLCVTILIVWVGMALCFISGGVVKSGVLLKV
jgi:hypothetical protein